VKILKKSWPVAICVLLVAQGCASKKAVKPGPGMPALGGFSKLTEQVIANANTFSYYSAKGKVEYKDPETEQDLGVQIVMEKGQYIWINVTAILGIEAARMLIKEDSVIILDRLHHKCILTDLRYFKKAANAELTLESLQDLFIGNAPYPPSAASVIDTTGYRLVITTLLGTQKQTAWYDKSLKATRAMLEDPAAKKELQINYADPFVEGANAYPSSININIRAEKSVECKIMLGNFVFDKKKEVQFSIPKTYEVVKP
jgi:hypothetical protein